MKKSLIYSFIFCLAIFPKAFAKDNNTENYITVSNGYFSLTLPNNTKGTYIAKKKSKGIFIYDKLSKKAGFGGFAFGIQAYKKPSEYATMPRGRKIGELVSKKNVLYDMVLIQPTDVQFDYTKSEEPKSYMALYNFAESTSVKGIKGNTYHKNQGMKGGDLYKEVLQKHVKAIKEKWDSKKLEQEGMSYMYNVLSKSNKNVLNKVGYAYYDANGDGIEELFIGEIAEGNWKGVVYDIYTMVDRKPAHVTSGGSRNRYFVCDESFICREYSSGAMESGMSVYFLNENSIELFPQVSLKYDKYENPKQPWFISYGIEADENKWENISEKTFNERQNIFKRYKRFDFIPLSKFKF